MINYTIAIPSSSIKLAATLYPSANLTTISLGISFLDGSTITSQSSVAPPPIDYAYNQANTATALAQQAYNVANTVTYSTSVDNVARATAQAAFIQANTVSGAFTQSTANTANSAQANTIIIQGVDLYQNTQIQGIQGVDNTQNTWISSNIAYIAGVDATQNNYINMILGIDAQQNTWIASNSAAIIVIQGVDLYQNSQITAVNQYAQSAYAAANSIGGTALIQYIANTSNSASANTIYTQGVDLTQNTQIAGIQGVDLVQNTSISIIQGVDLNQNTQIAGIQGVDIAQNSAITIIQGVDLTQNTQIQGIQGVDLTQNTSISILQGVNLTQNSWISSNAAFTQAAFNKANLASAFSGFLGNSIIYANAAGYLSNSASFLFISSNNALYSYGSAQVNSLGVGTPASGTLGEIRAANEVTAYFSSDERLKENIKTIDSALYKLRKVRGVMFDWKDEVIEKRGGEDKYFVRKHDTGVIAQEIEQVLPEVVAVRQDGYKAVKYEKLAGLIIQAINELADEVEEIKDKIQ
jgi:hypothetical protein